MAKLAAHEMLEVHELVAAKNLAIQKETAYLEMAKDPDLKDLIKTGLNDHREMLNQLQQALGGLI